MRRTASDLKIRLSRSENTSSPLALVSMSLIVTGPVCRQAIDELEGSTNQFPLESLSIRLRLNRLIWQVTPCTFGSATASMTMLLPVQSFRNRPTSSAAAREITARRVRQLTIKRATKFIHDKGELIIDFAQCGSSAHLLIYRSVLASSIRDRRRRARSSR